MYLKVNLSYNWQLVVKNKGNQTKPKNKQKKHQKVSEVTHHNVDFKTLF